MTLTTPVAFHIFNRPQFSNQVFAAIAQARPQKLLIIADGPRVGVPDDIKLCKQARAIVEQVDWDCQVLTHFSETNLGVRLCNAKGLDWVFSEVEEAIVLEDDCLPNASFFQFCQSMLEQYRHDQRIMSISGSNFLLDALSIPETYTFSRFFVFWGWASWQRAWRQYNLEMTHWPQYHQQQQLSAFFAQKGLSNWLTQLFDWAYENQLAWDLPWFYSCLFNHGLTIIPEVNLISNIGVEGTHAQQNQGLNHLPTFEATLDPIIHPDMIFQNQLFEQAIYQKFAANTPTSKQHFARKMKSKLKRILSS